VCVRVRAHEIEMTLPKGMCMCGWVCGRWERCVQRVCKYLHKILHCHLPDVSLFFTDLFQELFRQDLLVASLFRNFLLAERIMRSYNCTPQSQPQLPPTYHHPLWDSWDMALDHCLSQLKGIVEGTATYQVSL